MTHLTVKHRPDLPPLEDDTASSQVPLAHLASFAGSAALLSLTSMIVWMRGLQNRDITGALILLLGLNLPYLVSPVTPGVGDLLKLMLGSALFLALWSIGGPITELKWFTISMVLISVYSIIGALIMPEYFMYNTASEKAIVGGWDLAGPFGHANALGMYCTVAFAFVPLIPGFWWRLLNGSILLATMVASASRTALISAGIVALWWLICWFRSVISIRLVGTVLVGVSAAAMFVFPFLPWDPHALSDRASVWAASLGVWRESPWVGLGVNWFLTDARLSANTASWAFVGTGHNLVVDTLVKTGLLGLGVLVPVFLAALFSTRALRVTSHQIACFGYLIAFFVAATTEAVWTLLPNLQIFQISGLIFAVLILARPDGRVVGASS